MHCLITEMRKTNTRNQGNSYFLLLDIVDYMRVADKDSINKFVHKEMDFHVNNHYEC